MQVCLPLAALIRTDAMNKACPGAGPHHPAKAGHLFALDRDVESDEFSFSFLNENESPEQLNYQDKI